MNASTTETPAQRELRMAAYMACHDFNMPPGVEATPRLAALATTIAAERRLREADEHPCDAHALANGRLRRGGMTYTASPLRAGTDRRLRLDRQEQDHRRRRLEQDCRTAAIVDLDARRLAAGGAISDTAAAREHMLYHRGRRLCALACALSAAATLLAGWAVAFAVLAE